MSIDVVCAEALDFDEIVRLQRECFKGVTGSTQRDDVQTADYYHWKYFPACGSAKIAQIRNEDGELTAMSAMFPAVLRLGDKTIKGWQACDFASNPSARGKGWLCLRALNEMIREGEVFFGYPNANSAPVVTKVGWKKIDTLNVFIGVVPSFFGRAGICQVDQFGPTQDDLAPRLASYGRVMSERSAAYMNTRYCSPKRPLYTSFICEHDGACEGFIVVRKLEMRGLRVCVIMDWLATSPAFERRLFLHAGSWAWAQGIFVTVVVSNLWKRMRLAGRGLLPFPQQLSPRPLVLMVNATGSTAQSLMERKWIAHVGDWDGL
jgi:hypothetical protein